MDASPPVTAAPKKVLVVEDHADIRMLIRMTLELEGYELCEATDATAAIEQARRMRPDLILLDMRIPGPLTGQQLCRHWRGDDALRATRIVALTSPRVCEAADDGLESGAHACVPKPFGSMQLAAVVRAQCATR